MTASEVIKEIENLPPEGQAQVIQFSVRLAQRRQLSADELGALAEKLAQSQDPAEIARLRSAMVRGFYGE